MSAVILPKIYLELLAASALDNRRDRGLFDAAAVEVHSDSITDFELPFRLLLGWHESSLASLYEGRHMVHDCGNGFSHLLVVWVSPAL